MHTLALPPISQAFGPIDRLDPDCEYLCTASPFIKLTHTIKGSYKVFDKINGMWDAVIATKTPGHYAIRLEVDGVTSPILYFGAYSKAARLTLVGQPKTRLDGNASNPGDLFDVQPCQSNNTHDSDNDLMRDATPCHISVLTPS